MHVQHSCVTCSRLCNVQTKLCAFNSCLTPHTNGRLSLYTLYGIYGCAQISGKIYCNSIQFPATVLYANAPCVVPFNSAKPSFIIAHRCANMLGVYALMSHAAGSNPVIEKYAQWSRESRVSLPLARRYPLCVCVNKTIRRVCVVTHE